MDSKHDSSSNNKPSSDEKLSAEWIYSHLSHKPQEDSFVSSIESAFKSFKEMLNKECKEVAFPSGEQRSEKLSVGGPTACVAAQFNQIAVTLSGYLLILTPPLASEASKQQQPSSSMRLYFCDLKPLKNTSNSANFKVCFLPSLFFLDQNRSPCFSGFCALLQFLLLLDLFLSTPVV
jgi:hypothetical protein